ncbi:MAG TPA: thioredoxin domain-containing protein, partial [Minicystis sp.]|nr:thioredoxin domain-containing protein [Minicystis sp.]
MWNKHLAGLAAVALLAVACGGAPPPAPLDAHVDATRAAAATAEIAPAADAQAQPGPVPVTKADPQWGSPDALVTVVEFGDFQCPFTRRAAATLKQLRDKYGPKDLRVVWKNEPLPFHTLAPAAHLAAMVAFARRGDAGFWAFHDTVFGTDRPFSDELYGEATKAAGISPADVEAEAARARAKIDADVELGKRVGATGTPHFFINGKHVSGAQPFDAFVAIVDVELAKARALVATGVPRGRVYALRSAENFVAAPPPAPKAPEPPPDTTTVWRVPVGASPSRGNRAALVTIVEFADYQCPFCGRVEVTLGQLAQLYGDKLRVVYKDNPLPFHPHAEPATEVALEVRARKGDAAFWKFHDALFADQTHLEDAQLADAAAQVGLDRKLALAAIQSKKHAAAIDESKDLAEDVEAQGTPTFFINGRKLVGAQPIEKFRAIIDDEIAHAADVVKRGVPASRVYDELTKAGKSAPEPNRLAVPAPTAANPSRGPANAPVVVQVFSDFQCPFCKRLEPTLLDLEKAFPGKIRIVWRNLP